MTSETIAGLTASLGALDVGWTEIDPGGLDDALVASIDKSAVGVEFPFGDVSLLE